MKCPKCESDKREGVHFYNECGAKFELICPCCNAKLPLSKKFCKEYDQSLTLPSEHAPQEFSFDQKYKRFKNTFPKVRYAFESPAYAPSESAGYLGSGAQIYTIESLQT